MHKQKSYYHHNKHKLPGINVGRSVLCLVIMLTFFYQAVAQINKEKGNYQSAPVLTFLQDSVQVGEPLRAQLTFLHDKNLEVMFPDTAFKFTPFEYLKREIYSTTSNDSMSLDCTVYVLQAFELDSVQSLRMEVELYLDNQKIKIPSNSDTVYLQEIIDFQPKNDSVSLKTRALPLAVETEVNTLLYLIILGSLLLIAGVLIAIFGRGILERIKINRLKKRHQKFVENFNVTPNHKEDFETEVHRWKSYLGTLDQKDIASMTTREIYEEYENTEVQEVLKAIDAHVYGGVAFNYKGGLESLIRLAEDRFGTRLNQIKMERQKKREARKQERAQKKQKKLASKQRSETV